MHYLRPLSFILTAALVLLACIRFEYNAPTWRVFVPGLHGGVVVMCVVAGFGLFRLLRTGLRLSAAMGIAPRDIPFPFYFLIPIGAAAVAINGHWEGPPATDLFGNPTNQ
jgi:hypothetical protein